MLKDKKIDQLHWSPFEFIFLLFISITVWFIWNWEFSRNYLDIADRKIFYFLNGLIVSSKTSQIFWALLNNRLADLIPGGFISLLFFTYIKDKDKLISLERIILVIFFIASATLIILVFKTFIFDDIKRLSPSLVIDSSIKLRDLVPWAYTNDRSHASFPGDHGTVMLLCVIFFKYFSNKKITFLSILILLFFILPRMISGAHWFTDIIIGSTIITASFYAFFVKTPLIKKIIDKVTNHKKSFLKMLIKKYFLNKFL